MKTIITAHTLYALVKAAVILCCTGCSVADWMIPVSARRCEFRASVVLPDIAPTRHCVCRPGEPCICGKDCDCHPSVKLPDIAGPDQIADAVSGKITQTMDKLNDSIVALNASIQSQTERLESMDARSKLAMRKVEETLAHREEKSPPAALNTIWMYCREGCDPCTRAANELTAYGFFELVVEKNEARHPDWVKKRRAAGEGYPILVWKNSQGTHPYSGWPGIARFIEEYNKSAKPKPKQHASYQNGYLRYGMYPSRWDWPGNLRSHLTQPPHSLGPSRVSTMTDQECIQYHDSWHDRFGCTEKPETPVKLAIYQPSPPVPAPGPDAPEATKTLRDANGTEWTESPPTVVSKRFYAIGPPAPPVVGDPPWWNNRIWHWFKAGPTYASVGYGDVMAVSTRKAARINKKIAKLQNRLTRHAARVAGRMTCVTPTFQYYNTAPRARMGFFRRLRVGLCPGC